ncbi:UNVERIFIED_ORG: DNA invertase Pin-like site-specific DNA recombinase [Arthrobacter sp. UYEF1]
MTELQQLKRAAIYVRQSQTEDGSISSELQEGNCRKLAERYGWDVTKVYDDLDITGGSTRRRDAYKELRTDFKTGKFDILLADDLSRFNRNTAESAQLHDEIPTATWKEGIQENRLFTDILSAFNADFLRKISERWSDALARRIKNGLPPSGQKQFGYDRTLPNGTVIDKDNKKPSGVLESYVLNEIEAEVVREAYRRYTAGEGARTICQDFTARGLPSAGPNGWYPIGFFDLLDKTFYSGKISHDGQEFTGSHEALLTASQWKKYRKEREERKKQTKPRNPKWMLSGLVECGQCGGKMLSHMARGVPNLLCATYNARGKSACPGTFRKRSKVQMAVWWWLGAHLDEWASAMPSDEEGKLTAETNVANAETGLEAARDKYSRYQRFAFESSIRAEESKDTLAEYSTEIDEAQAVLDEALAELGGFTPAADVHEQISNGALLMGFSGERPKMYERPDGEWEDAAEEISEASTAQFREALSKIIEKVIVHPATGKSPRDPNRDHRSEVEVVPRKL